MHRNSQHASTIPLYRAWNLATWQLMRALRADDGTPAAMDVIADARRAEQMARSLYEFQAETVAVVAAVDEHGLTASDRAAIRRAHDDRCEREASI